MARASAQFVQVADALSDRFAELTGAPVLVVDERGTIVAACERALIGRRLAEVRAGGQDHHLRVPVHADGHSGEVLLAPPANGEVLSPRMARAIVELVVSQVLAVSGLPKQHELKNKFIHDLLHGRLGGEAEILREAQILGMSFSRPRAVILIDAAPFVLAPLEPNARETSEARIRRRSQLIVNSVVSFFKLPNEMICAYIGEGEVAVLKASRPQDLSVWSDPAGRHLAPSWADIKALKRASADLLGRLLDDTGSTISIGIGRYHPGVKGLAHSYQDARTALALGRRFQGPNQVHCLDDLGVAAFVGISDDQTKLDLARQLLSPLDAEPDLLKTLEVYFAADCSPSMTAGRLPVHRNTLNLRLNKIRSLTGLDPHKFDDVVLIRLAMLLRSSANGQHK